jgi:hypothetical protein
MKKNNKNTQQQRKKNVLLPLLHVLKSINPEQRVIILAHMDEKTRDAIYETITHVLTSDHMPIDKRILLKNELGAHKKDLRYVIDKKKGSLQRRKKLAQIGGGPMTPVLKLAIPLLLNMFPS